MLALFHRLLAWVKSSPKLNYWKLKDLDTSFLTSCSCLKRNAYFLLCSSTPDGRKAIFHRTAVSSSKCTCGTRMALLAGCPHKELHFRQFPLPEHYNEEENIWAAYLFSVIFQKFTCWLKVFSKNVAQLHSDSALFFSGRFLYHLFVHPLLLSDTFHL